MKKISKKISLLLTLSLVISMFIGTKSAAIGIEFQVNGHSIEIGESYLVGCGQDVVIRYWATTSEFVPFVLHTEIQPSGITDTDNISEEVLFQSSDPPYVLYIMDIDDSVNPAEISVLCLYEDDPAPAPAPAPVEEEEYWLSGVEADILQGITNGESIVYSECDSALSNEIMQSLLKNNIGLDYKFTYDGVAHEIFIPAGEAVDDDTPWYGPLWLLEKYGEYDRNAKQGTYTVVSGDTMNDIAEKLGVTLEYLLSKNPQIKDANKIFAGDKIAY